MEARNGRRSARFVSAANAAEAWRRWRAASRALPDGTWRRYWTTAGFGFVLLLGASIGTARLAATVAQPWLADWDHRALTAFVEHAPIGFVTGILLESGGNLLYLVPLTTGVALVAAWHGRALTAVGVIIAYWLCRVFVFAGWFVWDRARPDLVHDGIGAPGAHSFPSGHAALAAASYGYLLFLWLGRTRNRVEQGIAVLLTVVFVVLVVAGRLRIGSHWPSDVIVGLVLGGAWAGVLAVAEVRARRLR